MSAGLYSGVTITSPLYTIGSSLVPSFTVSFLSRWILKDCPACISPRAVDVSNLVLIVNFLLSSGFSFSLFIAISIDGLKFWSASLAMRPLIASSLSAISLASSFVFSWYFLPRSSNRAWISSRDLPSAKASFSSLSALLKLDWPKISLMPSDILSIRDLSSSCGFLLFSFACAKVSSKLFRALSLILSSGVLKSSVFVSVSTLSFSAFEVSSVSASFVSVTGASSVAGFASCASSFP